MSAKELWYFEKKKKKKTTILLGTLIRNTSKFNLFSSNPDGEIYLQGLNSILDKITTSFPSYQ
jgi:hypothetical protein